jgi:hypothetical protein
MTDAYQCDRCGDYESGSGTNVRCGEYCGTSGFTSKYEFWHKAELCDECRERLENTLSEFFRVER